MKKRYKFAFIGGGIDIFLIIISIVIMKTYQSIAGYLLFVFSQFPSLWILDQCNIVVIGRHGELYGERILVIIISLFLYCIIGFLIGFIVEKLSSS